MPAKRTLRSAMASQETVALGSNLSPSSTSAISPTNASQISRRESLVRSTTSRVDREKAIGTKDPLTRPVASPSADRLRSATLPRSSTLAQDLHATERVDSSTSAAASRGAPTRSRLPRPPSALGISMLLNSKSQVVQPSRDLFIDTKTEHGPHNSTDGKATPGVSKEAAVVVTASTGACIPSAISARPPRARSSSASVSTARSPAPSMRPRPSPLTLSSRHVVDLSRRPTTNVSRSGLSEGAPGSPIPATTDLQATRKDERCFGLLLQHDGCIIACQVDDEAKILASESGSELTCK